LSAKETLVSLPKPKKNIIFVSVIENYQAQLLVRIGRVEQTFKKKISNN
jgi:hypothetical protein